MIAEGLALLSSWLSKKHDTTLFIDDSSRVACPLRLTDVDVEECWRCQKLSRVVDGDPSFIECDGWRDNPHVAAPQL